MNSPDAYGQFYHPTPTPAAMGYAPHNSKHTNNQYSNTHQPIVLGSGQPDQNNYDQGPWQQSNYYYGGREQVRPHFDIMTSDFGSESSDISEFYTPRFILAVLTPRSNFSLKS